MADKSEKVVRIAVIIPAFNEEKCLKRVVEEVLSTSCRSYLELIPVVVNDCSLDRTAEVANELPCVLLDLPVNLGIGGAVQTGLIYAREQDFDAAVQVDGDGQHPSYEIPRLYETLLKEKADVVIGSRFVEGKGFQSTGMRRVGIGWFYCLNRFLTGYRIKDSTSGFRLLGKRAIALLSEHYPDDYPEPEAIVILAKNKLRVTELPVEMRERFDGRSSIDTFQSVFYMWKVTLGIFFTFIRKYD